MKDIMKTFGASLASILGMFTGLIAVSKIIEVVDHKKSSAE